MSDKPREWTDDDIYQMVEYGRTGPTKFVEASAYEAIQEKLALRNGESYREAKLTNKVLREQLQEMTQQRDKARAEIARLQEWNDRITGRQEYQSWVDERAKSAKLVKALRELVEIIEDREARKQIDSFTAQPGRVALTEYAKDSPTESSDPLREAVKAMIDAEKRFDLIHDESPPGKNWNERHKVEMDAMRSARERIEQLVYSTIKSGLEKAVAGIDPNTDCPRCQIIRDSTAVEIKGDG